ncbi:Sulfotransferase domain-containing protein [Aquimarina amphilecti]|uniref:Sulfotransferase domain-containing protein n=1 Tax=Aquimarina amphilecti TaxID=1038014 RepID=A0A1H7QCQ2_AQUAM|nr:sulfotransferase domain-containing protein [Aquimarina amphilecti]SEL45666.1 Sulfotransferase domain-containing protein [Aquimarina amphilecti]
MASKRIEYLFVMGHMRSRSSLLTHILLSHPTMVGLGESNAVYESNLKLLYMKSKTLLKNRSVDFFEKIYVDQINHNSKTPNPKIFQKKNLKMIILARPPDPSVASIMALTKKHYTPWSDDKSKKYYSDRMSYLIKLKERLPDDQCLVINSDELVRTPNVILDKISEFLEMSTPLKSEYETFNFTGTSGDPSANIKEGKIINNSQYIDLDTSKYPEEYKLFNQLVYM